MSDPAPSAAPTPAATPARALWVEFLIFFALGFGAMALYWYVQRPAPQQSAPAVVAQGKPLIELGAKSASDAKSGSAETASPETKTAAAPATAEKTAAKSAEAKTTNKEDDAYAYTSWETLAGYFYQPPDPEAVEIPGMPKPKHEIPKSVQDLSGTKVLVSGFMVPLRTKKGEVTEFVLCKTVPTCCFGDSTRMNEWIHVKMPADKTCQYTPNQSITVFGKLDVGEVLDQGIVISIYRMKADQVAGPPEL